MKRLLGLVWDRKKINVTLIEEKNRSNLEDFSAAGIASNTCKKKSSRNEWIFPSRRATVIFLQSLCIILVTCLVQRQTLGFSLNKISTSDLPQEKIPFTQALPEEEGQSVKAILQQPFRLAASGSECFVFFSKDGEYVLKLFKLQKWRFVYFKKGVWRPEPSVSPELSWTERYWQCRKNRILSSFTSCEIARTLLKDETAICYLHLTPTKFLHEKTSLIDSSGIIHLVDLDRTAFVLQKRCTPLTEALAQRDAEGIHTLLLSLTQLIETRVSRGIADRDPRVRNLGLLADGKVIALDLGSFYLDPHIRLEEQQEATMEQVREFLLHE